VSVRKLEGMKGASPYLFKQDRFSSHAQIANQLRPLAPIASANPTIVLDVGCAAGFLRAFLPESDFYIVGVERDSKLAAQARQQYNEVHQADLTQDLNLPLLTPHAVVLADILEHLPDPETVLTNLLQQYVKPGTPVIISLPNVAHLYVRLSLLLGRFEYSDRGILDRTHLRFFTLKTAQRLCTNCGVQIKSINVTPLPLPLVHSLFGEGQPLFPLHSLSAFLASAFKGLLAYQFILRGVYEP
jgi:2-polyprenyl-3-methyl-5-hydroxy-6-metoxy-1,4-benzoquinol methylase